MAFSTPTAEIIRLARKNVDLGVMASSARLCLAEAVASFDDGHYDVAAARAVKSLAYSVGIFHPDYKKAAR